MAGDADPGGAMSNKLSTNNFNIKSQDERNINPSNTNNKDNVPNNGTTASQRSNTEREFARKIRYEPTDKGPFCVFVEKGGEPVNIAKFGELIVSMNYKHIDTIVQINRRKIKVQATDYITANRLLNDNKVSSLGYDLFVPVSFLMSSGVVSNIPVDVNLDFISDKIKCIGRYQNTKIDNIERMRRWNPELKVAEPCDKIIITFRSQRLPEEVVIFFAVHRVKLYTRKPMLCKSCFRYGHPAVRCNGPRVCANCTQSDHDKVNCNNPSFCSYCKEEHQTGSKICAENSKQQAISNLMASKKLTYFEAAKQFNNDYCGGFPQLGHRPQKENALVSEMAELRKIVESLQLSVRSLQKTVEDKDKIIADLKSQLATGIQNSDRQVTPTQTKPLDNKQSQSPYVSSYAAITATNTPTQKVEFAAPVPKKVGKRSTRCESSVSYSSEEEARSKFANNMAKSKPKKKKTVNPFKSTQHSESEMDTDRNDNACSNSDPIVVPSDDRLKDVRTPLTPVNSPL